MGLSNAASRAGSGRATIEWPTWLALAGCYLLWGIALWQHAELGWFWCVPAALSIAFHSSLQHEALHGHPTRSLAVNEALVFPALGLFVPYRRFRQLHLTHHNDEQLTDPYDDPESYYIDESEWLHRNRVMRALLAFNATFAGRMTIGPALAIYAFLRSEIASVRSGRHGIVDAWLRHVAALLPVGLAIHASGIDPLWYVLGGAYPGYALIMMRSFIEHRAAEEVGHRTAIVEGCPLTRLLFLNNNFHAVHHAHPRLPWYRIREVWEREREAVLARNGGYLMPGYGCIARNWLVRGREPVVHPFRRRGPGGAA